ncbi:MAG: FAD-dependent oxidoreductase [Candidatus Omnitrophica bacterium]|nr:FAD-dependent oxidoreductase [Candidatus Omnitrophota bacterium]
MKKMGRLAKQHEETELVVVGAGLAGVCAAIAAARRGIRVTLIEKESSPGGMAAGLRHRFMCGLFTNSASAPRKYLNRGLTEEVCRQVSSRKAPVKMGKVWLLPYDPDRLMIVLHALLTRERNIQVSYGSKVISCSLQAGSIQSVQYSCFGKLCQFNAAVFIDAGVGILLDKCKAFIPLDPLKRQMSGFAVEMDGVPWDDDLSFRVPYVLYQAVQREALPLYARWTVVMPCAEKGRLYLKLSLPAMGGLPLAGQTAMAIVRILRQKISAFSSAKIVWQAPDVFSRDVDRLDGRYVFKDNDLLVGKKFSDAVVKGSWPMEFWDLKRGPQYRYLNGDHYELPLRSLRANKVFNLFSAGRSVSAEPGAQASLRVGGLCLATGEAAGNAAVDYLKNASVTE